MFHTLFELRKLSMKIFKSWLSCSGALYVCHTATLILKFYKKKPQTYILNVKAQSLTRETLCQFPSLYVIPYLQSAVGYPPKYSTCSLMHRPHLLTRKIVTVEGLVVPSQQPWFLNKWMITSLWHWIIHWIYYFFQVCYSAAAFDICFPSWGSSAGKKMVVKFSYSLCKLCYLFY